MAGRAHPPGCACKVHSRSGCAPGCTCHRHDRAKLSSEEARKRRNAASRRHRERHRAEISAQRKRDSDPEKLWAASIWSTHRMRPDDWQRMWDEQHGRCCYCERPLPEDKFHVHIDHDHSCTCGPKKTCAECRRGLACRACNAVVGFAGDDPERLKLITANLERLSSGARRRVNGKPVQEELPLNVTPLERRKDIA